MTSYPEVSRLDTRSRSRDLGAPVGTNGDGDWRETMGYLMSALANDDSTDDDRPQRVVARPLEGRLSEMSINEGQPEDHGPPALSQPSSDYLLALSSSTPGESSTKRAPSFDDVRSRGNSNEIYAEIFYLL